MLDMAVQATLDGNRTSDDVQLEAELAAPRSAQPDLEVEISSDDDLSDAWFDSFDPQQFVAYE